MWALRYAFPVRLFPNPCLWLAPVVLCAGCAHGTSPVQQVRPGHPVDAFIGIGGPPTGDARSGQVDMYTVPPAPDDALAADVGVVGDGGGPDAPDAPPGPATGAPAGSGGTGGAYPGVQHRQAAGVDTVVYIPASYTPDVPAPLVGLFHGQGSNADEIVGFFEPAADAGGFVTVAVTASGAHGGWVGTQDVTRFSSALTDTLRSYNIDQKRLYLWGFSAGGHFVHGLALDNANLFSAYAVVAGTLDAYATQAAPGRATRKIPVQVLIGRQDPLHTAALSDRTAFLAAGWVEGENYSLSEFDGGQELRAEHPGAAWAFLSGFSREP